MLNIFLDIDKKEVLGRLFLSLHFIEKNKTYSYHLKNEKMEHSLSTVQFEIDFNFNQFYAGAQMFTPRRSNMWENEKTEIRNFNLAT